MGVLILLVASGCGPKPVKRVRSGADAMMRDFPDLPEEQEFRGL